MMPSSSPSSNIPGTQVGDFSLRQLQQLRWQPGGQHVLTVQEAVKLTSPLAERVMKLVHETKCDNCLIW